MGDRAAFPLSRLPPRAGFRLLSTQQAVAISKSLKEAAVARRRLPLERPTNAADRCCQASPTALCALGDTAAPHVVEPAFSSEPKDHAGLMSNPVRSIVTEGALRSTCSQNRDGSNFVLSRTVRTTLAGVVLALGDRMIGVLGDSSCLLRSRKLIELAKEVHVFPRIGEAVAQHRLLRRSKDRGERDASFIPVD